MTDAGVLELRVRRVSGIISTDDILPARYKHASTDPTALAAHVFENALPGFAASLRAGDVLVSEQLFGVGSSREQAVSSLAAAGVRAVLAPAFGRIFFRNAWNLGMIALETEALPSQEGESILLSLESGIIQTPSGSARFVPVSSQILEMYRHGGLLPYLRGQLAAAHEKRHEP